MTSMIVDANSMYARSWFAAQREMPGQPIEAITLMMRTLLILLAPHSNKIGTHIDATLFAWDAKQNDLKGRVEKPAEYHETKALVMDVVELVFNAVNYQHPDFEGDDIVATAVANAISAKPNDTVYVVSADKDLQQLQGSRVHYYCLNTKAELSTAFINKRHYVHHPEQIALTLAIIGDPVDNIKGVRGWGPAKCRQLFEAVRPDMDFDSAMECLGRQMPIDKQKEFLASLGRTLLKKDVPGVPAPARLRLASPSTVKALGIPGVSTLYSEVYDEYLRNSPSAPSRR